MQLFLQNVPAYRILQFSGGGGAGEVHFCYLYFCGVLLKGSMGQTQASRPAAEGAGATGNVHPDTN